MKKRFEKGHEDNLHPKMSFLLRPVHRYDN